MNLRIGALVALCIAASTGSNARADELPPPVAAAQRADAALQAFHIDGKIADTPFAIDCVRPHDFRLSARGIEMLRVGSSLYQRFNGNPILAPAPAGTVVAFNQRKGLAYFISQFCAGPVAVSDATTFADAGDAEIDGLPMHAVRASGGVLGDPTETARTLYLGSDGRCHGVDIGYADGSKVSLRFSRFDDIPKLTRPVNGS